METGKEREGEGHYGALATYPPALPEKMKIKKNLSFQITHWKAQNRREEEQGRRARAGPRWGQGDPCSPLPVCPSPTPKPSFLFDRPLEEVISSIPAGDDGY